MRVWEGVSFLITHVRIDRLGYLYCAMRPEEDEWAFIVRERQRVYELK